jgi:polyisoprenoid-binding protein YceI
MTTTTPTQINTEAGAPGTWAVDTAHSAVGFVVDYLAGTIQGSFPDIDAVYGEGVLSGAARVASVHVKDPSLESYLQAPDFFDAGRYPEITFASRDIDRDGDRLKIHGEITIKGHTEPVEIIGAITDASADGSGEERMRIKLETKLDRKKFGISWKNPLPSGDQALAREVTLIGDLQMCKRA